MFYTSISAMTLVEIVSPLLSQRSPSQGTLPIGVGKQPALDAVCLNPHGIVSPNSTVAAGTPPLAACRLLRRRTCEGDACDGNERFLRSNESKMSDGGRMEGTGQP